ncbi:EAL domain-containing protein [Massilia sp. Dwa41.01b]|uniref:putative bifunctional diguanylate cyclase/phosphodiesterase n=1 Tax=Massilia sp. Dwa41.01b TaxID=2709302 RepID=UPI0015FF6A75|nr:EAL domain-containing protein [Massilia sp. Dwa41.01b]QNA89173.1 EAL domain-containing protein [Massilia sp. Dwa41.01b]
MDEARGEPGVDRTQLESLWTLVDNLDACFYVKDTSGRYLFANKALAAVFGADPAQIIGHPDTGFVDMAASDIGSTDHATMTDAAKVDADEVVQLRSGERRTFRTVKLPLFDKERRVIGLCGISTDITEQRRAVRELIERNDLLNAILSNVDAAIYLKDVEGRYLYANAPVLALYDRPLQDLVGRTDAELMPPELAQRIAEIDREVLAGGERVVREEVIVGADGARHVFRSRKIPLQLPGQPMCLIGFSTEITELRGLHTRIEQERITDSLTGLANRTMFEAALEEQLLMSKLGAQRLQQCNVPLASLARLSGDEFAFILPHAESIEDVAHQVEQIRAFLAQPYAVLRQPLHLTFSAGISLSRGGRHSAVALLGRAEAAMYAAKDSGRDQYRFYSPQLGSTVAQRVELERDLRAAVGSSEFAPVYQPKVRRDGSVAGVEALIRWNRPGVGLVAPDKFIPLAEQLGLLLHLGRWVIEEACRQAASWREAGIGTVPVAVNLSTSQLTSAALPDYVFDVMREYGIGPGCLEMELTESMMMSDPDLAIAILHRLRGGGVALSIDDFGTGFSSMSYLRQLPVHYLKLDRSFVKNVADDPKDADLCAGIMALAHKLDMHVVAEGVETREQHQALAACDCDLFQGFLFSHPLPVAGATEFLRAARARHA